MGIGASVLRSEGVLRQTTASLAHRQSPLFPHIADLVQRSS